MTLGFVRPARLDDVVEITRIQLTTWRVAYRRLLPQHILDQLDEDWITRRWRDAIADPPTLAHRVLVAVEQQEPLDHRRRRTDLSIRRGFCRVRSGR